MSYLVSYLVGWLGGWVVGLLALHFTYLSLIHIFIYYVNIQMYLYELPVFYSGNGNFRCSIENFQQDPRTPVKLSSNDKPHWRIWWI